MKKTRKPQPRGSAGRFVATVFKTSDILRAIAPVGTACIPPPPQAYNGFGRLRNDIWYIDNKRAAHIIYEHLQEKRVARIYRQCTMRNCVNPNHYTHEDTMNLTSYQATQIWLSLIKEPKVLEVPAASAIEYNNNRNRLNKTRTKLCKENVAMQGLRQFEVSKYGQTMIKNPEDAFAILIRPTHVGTRAEDQELATMLGITPTNEPLNQSNQFLSNAFNAPLPPVKLNPVTGLPFPPDEEVIAADDILAQMGFAPKTNVGGKNNT